MRSQRPGWTHSRTRMKVRPTAYKEVVSALKALLNFASVDIVGYAGKGCLQWMSRESRKAVDKKHMQVEFFDGNGLYAVTDLGSDGFPEESLLFETP